ncbi:MAG: DUF975 family protein [Lachnospiraceae bacterium]|nr:DUF975 family protein [Lachnospiraceae bacterium]
MRTRKEMKREARQVFKKHYVLFIAICLIAAFLGVESTGSISILKLYGDKDVTTESSTQVTTTGETAVTQGTASDAIVDMMLGNKDEAEKIATGIEQQAVSDTKNGTGNQILGRSRGVLAGIVNSVLSGSFVITLMSALYSIGASHSAVIIMMILGSTLCAFLFWYLVKNIFIVVSRRMFLEGRLYKEVPIHRLLFLMKIKKWLKVAWVMFVESFFYSLWMLTIVGGIVKTFSYWLVPYIAAENPDMKACDVITLSRRMMKGHKWECFVFNLSYVGWMLLGGCTFGLSELFYSGPYKVAAFCEYYAELRKLAIDQHIEGAEQLNDEWLFKKPETDTVRAAYADVLDMIEQPEEESYHLTGIRGWIANIFGIIFFNNKEEKKYEENQMRIIRYRSAKEQVQLRCYPYRMSPIPEKEKRKKVGNIYYMRHYTVGSLILLFFIFSFVGWVWEVSLHLITNGVFVNRGTMYGPWLPIYGTGGILILILLNKLRRNPVIEFFAAIVLCGFVEYFSAYSLELAHGGKKWWDYSGYFLNFQGRICAEGLLVFGLGGMAIVYLAAPLLDNYLKKIPYKVLIPLCVVLLSVYTVDHFYSSKHPNEGKGITDYTGADVRPNLPNQNYRI